MLDEADEEKLQDPWKRVIHIVICLMVAGLLIGLTLVGLLLDIIYTHWLIAL